MPKPVPYLPGRLSAWFNADGSIEERPNGDDSIFAEWTASGYVTEAINDNTSNQWQDHFIIWDGSIHHQDDESK